MSARESFRSRPSGASYAQRDVIAIDGIKNMLPTSGEAGAAELIARQRSMPGGYAEARNMVFHKTVAMAAS